MAVATQPPRGLGEQRFQLHGVPWNIYVGLRDALDDAHSNIKLTYHDGELELMSPSTLHEEAKKILARLLEAWAVAKRVDLRGFGSTTFRRKAKKCGLEADECYKVGRLGPRAVPDIAIEVIVTSPLLDKLAVYAGLGVTEVWTWRRDALTVHRLVRGRYQTRTHSDVLPDLDLAQLVRFVRPGESHTELVIAYQRALRGRRHRRT
jgi:Uma2 family endonuclease